MVMLMKVRTSGTELNPALGGGAPLPSAGSRGSQQRLQRTGRPSGGPEATRELRASNFIVKFKFRLDAWTTEERSTCTFHRLATRSGKHTRKKLLSSSPAARRGVALVRETDAPTWISDSTWV
ncbi:hypothetical protein EYF80_042178 [Liparis tanakae]|uniref:Uncharacterized protein n=1 Tax=Liparis tanakae TaxID=230148 RepID=A0A4Z2G281_9TELE|nr:hypothetical protein EYF80_042178 [Liparis tanakae]